MSNNIKKPLKTGIKQFLRSMGLAATEENVNKVAGVVSSDELQESVEQIETEEVEEVFLDDIIDPNTDESFLLDYNKLTKTFNIVTIKFNRVTKQAKIINIESLGDFEPRALRDFNISVAKNLFEKRKR